MAFEVSKIITVRVKPDSLLRAKSPIAQEIIKDSLKYISASLQKGSVKPKSGLTIEEEKLLMGRILSLEPTDLTWNREVENYWANIRQLVDPNKGLPLEVGFSYPTKELMDSLEKVKNTIVQNNWSNIINKKNIELGVKPINTADYILYRYALVYSKCANKIEDIYNSSNILFYLEDPEIVKRVENSKRLIKRSAYDKFINLLVDPSETKNNILKLIAYNYGNINPKYYFELGVLDLLDKETKLEDFVTEYPEQFMKYLEDSDLEIKGLILGLLEAGLLTKLPNTEVIKDDASNTVIGSNLIEAVAWFKATTNKKIVDVYQARLVKVV